MSKFQFNLDYYQALYHEPLAQVIAQALPVFDIKFTFTGTFFLHACHCQHEPETGDNFRI